MEVEQGWGLCHLRGGDEKGRMGLGWSLGLGGEAIMSGRRLEASAWAPGECRALLAERGWPRRKKLVLYGEGCSRSLLPGGREACGSARGPKGPRRVPYYQRQL